MWKLPRGGRQMFFYWSVLRGMCTFWIARPFIKPTGRAKAHSLIDRYIVFFLALHIWQWQRLKRHFIGNTLRQCNYNNSNGHRADMQLLRSHRTWMRTSHKCGKYSHTKALTVPRICFAYQWLLWSEWYANEMHFVLNWKVHQHY